MADPAAKPIPATDDPVPAGPEPDAQNVSGHPSISLSAWLYAAQWAMDQAHAGPAGALLTLKLTGTVQAYPEADLRLPDGVNVVLDFNEGKQPVTFELTATPSAVTQARLNIEARLAVDRKLRAYAQEVGLSAEELAKALGTEPQ